MDLSHGFRIPLFFLISGFFTAMLWQRRGLKAVLMHRYRRVFLPCMLSVVIITPLTLVIAMNFREPPHERPNSDPLWASIQLGDAPAVRQQIADGADINAVHAELGKTYLSLAALVGQPEMVTLLLDQGADVNLRNRDGGTPLHEAAFLGRHDVFDLLIQNGADQDAKNRRGQLAQYRTQIKLTYTNAVARRLNIAIDRSQLDAGRARIQSRFNMPEYVPTANPLQLVLDFPVFLHLWFLYYLCWLVLAFAVVAYFADRWGSGRMQGTIKWLVMSPVALVGWMLLTMIPQWFWGWKAPEIYGPINSELLSIVPRLHGLAYYGLFFAFGAFYFQCKDVSGQLGRRWRITLPLAVLVVFPLGLEFSSGVFGFADNLVGGMLVGGTSERLIADALQVLYAWLMAIALIGLFRSFLVRGNKYIRYVSDSSYWLYIAHLPLVLFVQWLVLDWPLPVIAKFAFVVLSVTCVLLILYEYVIRYGWVGTLLNGRRTRQQPAQT